MIKSLICQCHLCRDLSKNRYMPLHVNTMATAYLVTCSIASITTFVINMNATQVAVWDIDFCDKNIVLTILRYTGIQDLY